MKLAVASPSGSAYSETFIAMQEKRLPCALRVWGKPVFSGANPGGAISLVQYGMASCLPATWSAAWRLRRCTSVKNGAKALLSALQTVELKRRLLKNEIDVALANFGPCGVGLMPACVALGVPFVVHFHGYDAHASAVVDYYRESYKALGKHAAALVVVSEAMASALKELGMPASKIRLARCGVDPDRFPLKQEFPTRPLFFGVGRFTEKKAPYLTVLAFKEVVSEFPNARLVLAGDGEYFEVTRNTAEGLNLGAHVEFPGRVTHEMVADYMSGATAFVQHSVTPRYGLSMGDKEGTPVGVMEAMMSGLPVVSTRHAGIGEVVQDGVSGFLCEERDVGAMAAAMKELASSPHRARAMGLAGRSKALKEFSAKTYIETLERILREALPSGRRS
jgi:colanic acid/amylovoran biosynthesis glycosyltransferase